MDQDALRYGRPWQPGVEQALRSVHSAAILIGPSGLGDWQAQEAQLCLTQGVKRGIPVIPVLLPGVSSPEDLPLFLREHTCADLRNDNSGERLRRLMKEILETRQPLDAPPAEPLRAFHGLRIHNLPFPPLGDLLKGRDEELRRLEANLQNQATAITQAISGLGGIGKTRLAVEYAWRSASRYDAALFVVAESPQALQSGLADLARPNLLNLSEHAAKAETETVDAVLRSLQENPRWLLILDNVDTPEASEAVRKILPQLQNGHVLITSRRKDWPATVRKQALDTLTLEEATNFLLQRTEEGRASKPDDPEQAGYLAQILGGLPLALEQAGAYIVHHQISFSSYLKDWEKERENVLGWYNGDVMEYHHSVATTWQTTFRQLRPTAAALLRLTAYLAPDPIPVEMFEAEEEIVKEAAEAFCEETGASPETQAIRDAISELLGYSMVTKDGETFTVHRIVQEVLRAQIPEDRRRNWIERNLKLVDHFSPAPPDDVRTWPVWDPLRPHAAAVVGYADGFSITKPTARLMAQLSLLLKTKGLYLEAEALIRRALTISENADDPDQSNVAVCLNNLAALLQATDRLLEAEPMTRRALEIFEQNLGAKHPNVATVLSNLAQLLQATNRLSEAEPMMHRALEIDEAAFGTTHPKVAIRLNNLASLLRATNRLTEAEPMMRRALEIDEATFGITHPNVAIRLNNLAQLLQDTNRLSETEPMMRRSLEILERSLGVDHPWTQTARRNLDNLLAVLGEITSAGSGSKRRNKKRPSSRDSRQSS
jgi:tetratricopeptide (TPR) repeat protein